MKIDFIKGHCGWDVVTLLTEGQIPKREELTAAIKIVSAPIDGGLEVGLLGRGASSDKITLRMVSSTAKSWIPMCGGMTQVIGKALIETSLQKHFDVDASVPVQTITLVTPVGDIPIEIRSRGGRVSSVTTRMDNYLSHLYGDGVEVLALEGVPVLRIGGYAVMDVETLEEHHPGVDFTRRDLGPHLDTVNNILRKFGERLGVQGVTAMLYDRRPEGPGQYRVFPRFYSDDLAAALIPWEFQCGTGTMAVAIALAHRSQLPFSVGSGSIIFEWGSYRSTPDPYGIRTSVVEMECKSGRLVRASFSHSVIEILSEGKLLLPAY